MSNADWKIYTVFIAFFITTKLFLIYTEYRKKKPEKDDEDDEDIPDP